MRTSIHMNMHAVARNIFFCTILFARRTGNALSFNGRFPWIQSLLRRCFRFASGTVHVTDFDGSLSLDLRLSEHMQRRIFWMGYYNREIIALLNNILRKDMVVLDIGANIGEISLVAANRIGKSGKVIAFEPIDNIADQLQKNVAQNRLEQITIARTALSDTICSEVPVYASWGQTGQKDEHHGLGSLYRTDTKSSPLQSIPTTTLDEWLKKNPLSRVDLIKIDIEGAELPCLKGAEQTLRKFKPQLIIEIQDESAQAAGYRATDILDFLSAIGYTFDRIGWSGELQKISRQDLKEYQNVLCTNARAEILSSA